MELKSLEFLFFAFLVIIAYFGVYRIPKAQKYVLLGANTFFIWKAVAVLCYFKFFKQTFILIQQLIAEYGCL